MKETVIKKRKYLRIPEELEAVVPDSNSVEKLAIHGCYNGKLQFHAKHWSNLRFIEFIDCSYMELSFYFPNPGKIRQIYISQSESIDIGEVLGYLPDFQVWRVENSKFIKFKGPVKGDIMLRSLEFNHVLRSEIFQQKVEMPVLEQISWENGCNFFKTDFSELNAPQLQKLSYKDSNYLNFQSLGQIPQQLTLFKFENCAYPKLNIDFKKLSKLSSNDTQPHENVLKTYFQPQNFRMSKQGIYGKRKSRKTPNPFRDPNAPDVQMIRNAPDPRKISEDAEHFLKYPEVPLSSSKIDQTSSAVKFCPKCGTKNPSGAAFCSNCGEHFRQ